MTMCKHPDKSHKLCVGGCVGSCKRVMEPIPCPKHDLDGVGPCYCKPPKRTVSTEHSDADDLLEAMGVSHNEVKSINSVRLGEPEKLQLSSVYGKFPEQFDPFNGFTLMTDDDICRLKATTVRDLIDEMITVHGISGKMLSDMQQYADQLERGEL